MMTPEERVRLEYRARGLAFGLADGDERDEMEKAAFVALAAAVAEEREACAKVADIQAETWDGGVLSGSAQSSHTSRAIAAAIRARSECDG